MRKRVPVAIGNSTLAERSLGRLDDALRAKAQVAPEQRGARSVELRGLALRSIADRICLDQVSGTVGEHQPLLKVGRDELRHPG